MKLRTENKAGLYFTVIVHLTVIIVLLIVQIDKVSQMENSFVLDFTREEELEKKKEEIEFKEDISKKLDALIAASAPNTSRSSSIKNAIVNSSLKDDRNTDADQLYKDAAKLDNALKENSQTREEVDASDETVDIKSPNKNNKDEIKSQYKGPSVLRYDLGERKATYLHIPAYKCFSGGEVTVVIYVNRSGLVKQAKIVEDLSSKDKCIREYAIRSARLSRFKAADKAPEPQIGEIVYQFIAQ